ncbi:MAG: patatin-like phospholipase family protein [Candidatus Berkiella sp.]
MPVAGIQIPEINQVWEQATEQVTLKREARPPIENLVLEGGGIKGFAYIGALEVLEQNGVLEGVQRVAGSSAGAILALFLSLGCSSAEMKNMMRDELDPKKLLDPRLAIDPTRFIKVFGMKVGISDIVNLFKNKGLFKTDAFIEIARHMVRKTIEEKLKKAIKNRDQTIIKQMENEGLEPKAIRDYVNAEYQKCLEKYYIEDPGRITFEQQEKLRADFPAMGFKELHITGTRLSNATLKVYSAHSDPKIEVVDAMVASACFPGAFEPMLVQGEYIADGGIASNYPMDIFNEERFLTHGVNDAGVNPCTLGILIDSEKEIRARWGVKRQGKDKLKIKSFIGNIIKGMHSRSDDLKNKYSINSIQIFDKNIETLNFSLTESEVEGLIESGRGALQEYIDHYMSDDVLYNSLPNYENVYEKYYAKRPEELVRIIEEKIWPTIQEINTFIDLLKRVDFGSEYLEIENQLQRFSQQEKDEQYAIYVQLDEIANNLDDLQNEISVIDKKLRSYDIKKRNIIANLDEAVKNNDSVKAEALQKSLIELIKKVSIVEVHKESLNDERYIIKENYKEIKKLIKKDIYELIEQKEKLQYLEKNRILAKLRKTENILQEHMDIALKALNVHKNDYPDPRINEKIATQLFQLQEEYFKEVLKIYHEKDHLSDEVALEKAQKRSEFYADVIQFGVDARTAKSLTQHFFAMQDIFIRNRKHDLLDMQYDAEMSALRRKFFRKLLIDEMEKQKLIQLHDDEEYHEIVSFWDNAVNDYLQDPTISLGYAESLAKEKTIKHWQERMLKIRQQLYKTITQEKKQHVDIEYALNLRQVTKQLGRAKLSDHVLVANRQDIKHNLMNTEKIDGETVGVVKTEYSVMSFVTKERRQRYSAIRNLFEIPPIEAHILVPRPETLHNPIKKSKELIVLFNEPKTSGLISEYSLAAKFTAQRKRQFAEHKQELIKKIIWALRQMQEEGFQPEDAKFKLTIAGEGLAGQDAQYLLSAVIDEINKSDLVEFKRLRNIDLILTDPARVSDSLAIKTAHTLHEMKLKRPDLHVKGYNLIHQVKKANHRASKKPTNYLGDANILSKALPEDASVKADFRDQYDSHLQHQVIDNKKESQRLKNELNESKIYASQLFVRDLNLASQKLKKISKFICFECLPKLVNFVGSKIVNLGKNLQNLPNSISRIARHFKKKDKIEYKIPDWKNVSTQRVETKTALQPERTWEEMAGDLINKTSPSNRLKMESRPPIENIVLEGGGTPTCAYLGALEQLRKNGQLNHLKRVAGSSGGGIIATLYSLGYTPSELTDLFINKIHLKDYLDDPFVLSGLGTLFEVQGIPVTPAGLFSLFVNKGLFKGDSFKKLIEKLIEIKLEKNLKTILYKSLSSEEKALLEGVPAFLPEPLRNKRIDDYLSGKLIDLKKKYGITDLGRISFAQAQRIAKDYPELNIKELYLTATKVNDASLKIFSHENEPDMSIADAAFIGACFPGVFAPVKYNDEYYVDGGIAGNYPMHIFDEERFLSHGLNDAMANPCTLGLIVDTKEDIEARWGILPSEPEALQSLTFLRKVLHGLHNRTSVLRGKYNVNSIQISDSITDNGYESVSKFSFELPRQAKYQLFRNGQKAVQYYQDQYANEDVQYSYQEEYADLYQKYSAKTIPQLTEILNNEILPILNEFKIIEGELREKQLDFQSELNKLEADLTQFAELEDLMRLMANKDSLEYELSLITSNQLKHEQSLLPINEAIEKALRLRSELLAPYGLPDSVVPPDVLERVREYDKSIEHYRKQKQPIVDNSERLRARQDRLRRLLEDRQSKIRQFDTAWVEKVNAKIRCEKQLAIIEQAFEGKGLLLQEENIILRMLANKGVQLSQTGKESTQYLERARPLLLSSNDADPKSRKFPLLVFQGAKQDFADKVLPLFPSYEWEHFIEGVESRFHHKTHIDEMMVVSHTDEGAIHLSGNPADKVSQVASALSELDCTLQANSPNEAIQYLRLLHATGFDVGCIKRIQIQGVLLADHQQMISQIKHSAAEYLKSKANSTK